MPAGDVHSWGPCLLWMSYNTGVLFVCVCVRVCVQLAYTTSANIIVWWYEVQKVWTKKATKVDSNPRVQSTMD